VAETVTNRGKYRLARQHVAAITWKATVFTGTQTGANSAVLNTVADLDGVTSISIHTERLTVGTVTYTEDDTNNRVNIDCPDLAFAAAPGITAQGIIFYDEGSGTDASRDLISVHTTGFPQPMDGGLNVAVSDFLRNS
jgi:hypothetical protein